MNATTRRDEHGNIIGVVGIGQDITFRIAQEREYSNLIENANAPIFGVDNEGMVNVWNQCAMHLVGYSTEEVMGHRLVEEFITKDYQASVQTVLDKALDGEETANFEFPLMTKVSFAGLCCVCISLSFLTSRFVHIIFIILGGC